VFPVLRLLLGLLAALAIGRQLSVQIQLGHSVLNFFSYFTNLSNLFAAVVLILGATCSLKRPAAFDSLTDLRAISVVNMAVVGIVFAILLRDVDLGSLLPWVNVALHYVMPCGVVLDWLVQPPKRKLGANHLLLCLVFPTCYLAYVLIRGRQIGWYPYPFLNPAHVGGYGVVALYALGITATFLIAGWSLLAAGNKLSRNKADALH
jgi:hypothetical protein